MVPDDFASDAAGTVRKMPSAYYAFIPTRPPERLDLREVTQPLAEASAALGQLSGLGVTVQLGLLPNPYLFIAHSVRREAAASTKIEGTKAGITELYIDEVLTEATRPENDVAEIKNYIAAMEAGRRKLQDLPFASRLVREIHAILLNDVRGRERRPGEFRTSQNWIGGASPTNALFVPPPPDELWRCIGDWERFANLRRVMPELVQCAIMHAHFETIHPFLDGNGRIGRLLITLFLIERGLLSEPLLYVSSYIEKHKAAYYETLQRTRTHGDWIGWVAYFLEAIRSSAADAVNNARALLTLRAELHANPALAKKARERRLIDELFSNPYVTVQHARKLLGVSTVTATRAIETLQALGILEERTGKAWGRIWLAKPILRALEE